MNKEQAEAKLREICAVISNERAKIQAGFSDILLRDWPEQAKNSEVGAELYSIMRAQLSLLLNETYDGKTFESGAANRAITCILMCSGLIEALQEENKGGKPCVPSLH